MWGYKKVREVENGGVVHGIGAVRGISVWNWCMECEYIQVLKAANTVPLWVASYSRQIETSQIVLTSASTVLWVARSHRSSARTCRHMMPNQCGLDSHEKNVEPELSELVL